MRSEGVHVHGAPPSGVGGSGEHPVSSDHYHEPSEGTAHRIGLVLGTLVIKRADPASPWAV